MSYHLGSTSDTLVRVATTAANQAVQTASTMTAAQKAAAIAAARAEAERQLAIKAAAALTINAALIKAAMTEKSRGALTPARWDYHAAQMRGSRYSTLPTAVKVALDAKIVGILGPRPSGKAGIIVRSPGVSLPTTPTLPTGPALPKPPAPPTTEGRTDSPPAADLPVPPITVDENGQVEPPAGDNTLLIAGAVGAGLIALMVLRK